MPSLLRKEKYHDLLAGLLLYACLGLASALAWAEESTATGAETPAESQAAEPYRHPDDPWEGFNRRVFAFNDAADRYVLKPVAKGYQAVTPQFVDDGLSNFFSNLGEIFTIFNDLLQLKFGQAASDTGRFVVNSTVGLLGFIDVASKIGLEKHDEDLGQTLGYWGLDSGPYLVLPFLGPSTLRDAPALVPEFMLNNEIDKKVYGSEELDYAATGLNLIDLRADLLSSERLIQGDRYSFIRSFYLQRREFLVNDGEVEDEFADDEFFEDEEFDD